MLLVGGGENKRKCLPFILGRILPLELEIEPHLPIIKVRNNDQCRSKRYLNVYIVLHKVR